ncbi:heme oxygenase-like protein [Hyaloscypha variabilis]
MARRIEAKLTDHLMNLDPKSFQLATQVSFLEKAGHGTLSKEILQTWLSQDRLYAQAYMRFASLLLANIRLPLKIASEDINEKLADLLVEALVNIRRELKFFESVAGRWGLDIDIGVGVESEGVKRYREVFNEVGEGIERGVVGLLEGLVVLWGTEKCYLEAWRYAATFSPSSLEPENDLDGGALRKEFIPNWTSGEFVGFVERIGGLVDALWEGEGEEGRVEELWRRMLDVERVFWPEV